VDFHVKDLVIPGRIPFFWWIPLPEASNSRRNNLLTVHVYSFCEKEISIFMIASTFFMLNFSDVSGIYVIFLLAITFLMQISLMFGILSYFVLLAGTFLMPNCSNVRRNKTFSDR
jgi:hypothetical protein